MFSLLPARTPSQLLRDAAIAYAMHAGPGHRPRATFRNAEGHGPTLSFAATIRNAAFQLLVPDLSPPSDPADAAASVCELNAGWGGGQACYAEQRGSYRLTSGYPVFARRQRQPLVPMLLASLYAVSARLSLPSESA